MPRLVIYCICVLLLSGAAMAQQPQQPQQLVQPFQPQPPIMYQQQPRPLPPTRPVITNNSNVGATVPVLQTRGLTIMQMQPNTQYIDATGHANSGNRAPIVTNLPPGAPLPASPRVQPNASNVTWRANPDGSAIKYTTNARGQVEKEYVPRTRAPHGLR